MDPKPRLGESLEQMREKMRADRAVRESLDLENSRRGYAQLAAMLAFLTFLVLGVVVFLSTLYLPWGMWYGFGLAGGLWAIAALIAIAVFHTPRGKGG